MTIDLSDHEDGRSFDGDYDAGLKALQERLEHAQTAHIVHGRRSIVLFEGWDAAGKGGIIKRATATMDPRYFHVWPIGAPNAEERARHFLWRFWTRLPGAGELALFDRSWYGRVLVERVEGFATEAEWRRGYDEINAFEAQQIDSGTAIVKIFVHITQKTQDREFAERLDDPWKRWKTGADDYRNRARRKGYRAALDDMFAKTDSARAPWIVIDGNHRKAARIAALTRIAEALEAHVPMAPPPADPAVIALAEKAFGYKPAGSGHRKQRGD